MGLGSRSEFYRELGYLGKLVDTVIEYMDSPIVSEEERKEVRNYITRIIGNVTGKKIRWDDVVNGDFLDELAKMDPYRGIREVRMIGSRIMRKVVETNEIWGTAVASKYFGVVSKLDDTGYLDDDLVRTVSNRLAKRHYYLESGLDPSRHEDLVRNLIYSTLVEKGYIDDRVAKRVFGDIGYRVVGNGDIFFLESPLSIPYRLILMTASFLKRLGAKVTDKRPLVLGVLDNDNRLIAYTEVRMDEYPIDKNLSRILVRAFMKSDRFDVEEKARDMVRVIDRETGERLLIDLVNNRIEREELERGHGIKISI